LFSQYNSQVTFLAVLTFHFIKIFDGWFHRRRLCLIGDDIYKHRGTWDSVISSDTRVHVCLFLTMIVWERLKWHPWNLRLRPLIVTCLGAEPTLLVLSLDR